MHHCCYGKLIEGVEDGCDKGERGVRGKQLHTEVPHLGMRGDVGKEGRRGERGRVKEGGREEGREEGREGGREGIGGRVRGRG